LPEGTTAIRLATTAVALAAGSLSCASELSADDDGVGRAASAITDDNLCLNGNITDAMNAMRGARGILTRSRPTGTATADFDWLDTHSLSGCHVQGLVNAYTGGIVFGFNKATLNNTFPATLFGNNCPEFSVDTLRPAKLVRGSSLTFTSRRSDKRLPSATPSG
jgi:hypothetical protein